MPRSCARVSENIKRYASEAIVIIVSNPLDVMCWVCLETTRFESHRVIGMAGVLDTTRMRYFIAEELGVYPADVMAMVAGRAWRLDGADPSLHHRPRASRSTS